VPYAVVMSDEFQQTPRHKGSDNFMFLDSHVDRIKLAKYWDPRNVEFSKKTDLDPWNCRCYWAWGLTRSGIDGGP
jgi:hypothetical protein